MLVVQVSGILALVIRPVRLTIIVEVTLALESSSLNTMPTGSLTVHYTTKLQEAGKIVVAAAPTPVMGREVPDVPTVPDVVLQLGSNVSTVLQSIEPYKKMFDELAKVRLVST